MTGGRQFAQSLCNGAKPFGERLRQLCALGRQGQPATFAVDQLDAKIRLQRADLLGDGGVRDIQRPCREGKALKPRGGFERTQRGQRREAAPVDCHMIGGLTC